MSNLHIVPNAPSILLSVTSCKRIDLFKRTVNSFINACTDVSLISEWICVDDNSSKEDRDEIQKYLEDHYWNYKELIQDTKNRKED